MSIGKYDEILNLPHHVSQTHPRMPMQDRAAQFAPFAALTGYDDVIREARRVTDERIELDEGALDSLSMKMRWLSEHLAESPQVTITYFRPDERKSGGEYLTVSGVVRKIDVDERVVWLGDGTKLRMGDVVAIGDGGSD